MTSTWRQLHRERLRITDRVELHDISYTQYDNYKSPGMQWFAAELSIEELRCISDTSMRDILVWRRREIMSFSQDIDTYTL